MKRFGSSYATSQASRWPRQQIVTLSAPQWNKTAQTLKKEKDTSSTQRLALLIDAENVPFRHINQIMSEVNKLGVVGIRRIYADWTHEMMRGWRQVVLTNALTPIHMFHNSIGKGSTDSALIIDAMDLLYTKKELDAFCIISSDADFTRLCTKLREEGKLVFGMGNYLTPAPFIVSCNRFVYLHDDDSVSSLSPDIPSTLPTLQQKNTKPNTPPIANTSPSAAVGKPTTTNNNNKSTQGENMNYSSRDPINLSKLRESESHADAASSFMEFEGTIKEELEEDIIDEERKDDLNSSEEDESGKKKKITHKKPHAINGNNKPAIIPKPKKKIPPKETKTEVKLEEEPRPLLPLRYTLTTLTRAWEKIRQADGFAELNLLKEEFTDGRNFNFCEGGFDCFEDLVLKGCENEFEVRREADGGVWVRRIRHLAQDSSENKQTI